MENKNKPNKNAPNNNNNKLGLSFIIFVTMLTLCIVIGVGGFQGIGGSQEITCDKFLQMVEDGEVEKVVIASDMITITTKKEDGKTAEEYYTGVVNDDKLTERLTEAGVEFNQEIPDDTSYVVWNFCHLFRMDGKEDVKRRRRHHGRWKEQCQDVCRKRDWCYI